jgi:AraC-like DNA-binding protein
MSKGLPVPFHRKQDRAIFWRDPSLGGIELMRAHFEKHTFARHAHDEVVIAVFEQGAERFEIGRSSHVAAAGSVLVIAPGVFHAGAAASGLGWTYRAFYPRPDLLVALRRDLFGLADNEDKAAPVQQIHDTKVYSALVKAHKQLEDRNPLVERQSALMYAFGALTLPERTVLSPRSEEPAIRRVRDYLESSFADEIGIDALAAMTGLSVAHLMRSFCHRTGVSIHAYLTHIRLRHARDMLTRSVPAVDVAAAVGFVDQSHLIRRFKKAYGVTPGEFARERRQR